MYNSKNIIIQARGLLYEEYKYLYFNKKNNLFLNLIHKLRAYELNIIEKSIYKNINNFTIESVSLALKNHLNQTYKTKLKYIKIAKLDLIKNISNKDINLNKNLLLKKLNLNNKYIYCYNGSGKAWQCPENVIKYFITKLKTNSNIFLLILSQDKDIFLEYINKYKLDKNYCLIISVNHNEISKYLSICNAGIIFRENHILNWVSRPTKILEYKSVNLKIIHNNTIEYLVNN